MVWLFQINFGYSIAVSRTLFLFQNLINFLAIARNLQCVKNTFSYREQIEKNSIYCYRLIESKREFNTTHKSV